MEPQHDNDLRAPTMLGEHFRRAFREMNARRPFSVYLLFAMLIVIVLGSQIVYVRDNPREFAFFLTLNFIFFFVVAYRAIVDFFEIARNHFREKEAVFRDTLGEPEFVQELGRSVSESRSQ